jgi:hypothetical protein
VQQKPERLIELFVRERLQQRMPSREGLGHQLCRAFRTHVQIGRVDGDVPGRIRDGVLEHVADPLIERDFAGHHGGLLFHHDLSRRRAQKKKPGQAGEH